MPSVDIRPSPPTRDFYEDVDDSGWKVDKLRKGFVCTMKEYITMYGELEAAMKEADVLGTSLAFVATKARLHGILCDIQTSFGPEPPSIPTEWRFKALTELAHKVNNNALRYKKRGRDSAKEIIEQSKRQDGGSDSSSDHWGHSREGMFRELSACTAFGGKIVLTKQSSGKMPKISCCSTAELVGQKKSLEEITAQDLDFDIWKKILREDGVITSLFDEIWYHSDDEALLINSERPFRAAINEMRNRGDNRFVFTVLRSSRGKTRQEP